MASATDLLRHLVAQPESREFAKQIMTNTMQREEVLAVVADKIMIAAMNTVASTHFQAKFNQLATLIVNKEEITTKAKSALVYKPLTNFITLGIYSLISSDDEAVTQTTYSSSSRDTSCATL